jgi:intein/homing endonuclease
MDCIEVTLEGYGFTFRVAKVPKDEIEDKLALASTETGLMTRIGYQNFLFAELILNIERLYTFIGEVSGGEPEEQIKCRNKIEALIYDVNPIFNPENLVLSRTGVVKLAKKYRGTPLKENSDWYRLSDDINPFIEFEEFTIVDESDILGEDEPLPANYGIFETVQKKWDRLNLDLRIRKFGKEDLGIIFSSGAPFPEAKHYKGFVVKRCIESADELFNLCKSSGLIKKVGIDTITDELYDLCLSVNPFLKASELDIRSLKNKANAVRDKSKRSTKKEDGTGIAGRDFLSVSKEELLNLADKIKLRVIGQDEAVDKIVDAVQIASCGLRDPDTPIATFLLCGNTGVGKTYSTKVLAEDLCGSRDHLIRVDCSEYTQHHDIQKLIGCFVPGTSVSMGGFLTKPIEDVEVGDRVITHKGRVRDVIGTFEYDYNGPIYSVTVAGDNRPVMCTPNHEFLAVRSDRCWYKNRDHVVCKPTCGRNRLSYPCTNKLYEKYSPEWVMAKDLKEGDLVLQTKFKDKRGYPEVLDLAEFYPQGEWDDKYIWARKQNYKNKINRFIPVNKDFVRLAGYYVAEGGVDSVNKRSDFSFHLDEKKYQEEVVHLVKTVFGKTSFFHTPPNEQKINKKRSRMYVHSAVIRSLFKSLFGGHGSENKQLPNWWLNLPDDLLRDFLTTAVFGDGCTTVSRRVEYATVSPNLFSQIRAIFNNLGYITHVQKGKIYGEGWKHGYKIYVSGEQVHRLNEELPGLNLIFGEISNPSKGVVAHSNIQRMSYTDDDYAYRQVKGLDVTYYEGKVYDLHVQDDTSYNVQGYQVHNSPPSYIGYEDGGYLTNAVQKNPFSVILFDEIEKAHSKLFDLLLQVIDDARLTDGKGRVADFKQCIILMTSNIGVSETEQIAKTMGFGDRAVLTFEKQKEALKQALKDKFRPEFLNRLDDVIGFKPLDKEDTMKIIDLLLRKVQGYLLDRDIEASFSKAIKEMLFARGFSKRYGARPIQRVLDREVVNGLAKLILNGKLKVGSTVLVDYRNGALKIVRKNRKNRKTSVS